MAICANQGRMYVGTARQCMDLRNCKSMQPAPVRMQRKQCNCAWSDDFSIRNSERNIFSCSENGCDPESLCADLPLAAAYVNPQPYTGLVDPDTALSRGSAFNNLYDPWNPRNHC